MRCFLAVDIPEKLKDGVSAVQQELAGLDTKLVEKENLHFTLKFLGEADEGKMKAAVKAMSQLKFFAPFSVRLSGVGFFPSKSFIRVVWIGAQSGEFLDLHMAVDRALSDLFGKEKPVPHLTLARVRSQTYNEQLQEFGRRHENEDFGAFEVSQIKLKKSTVSRKGPVYEDLQSWDLHDD